MSRTISLLINGLLLLLASAASADELILKDGSVLMGKIGRTTDGSISISTDFAGDLMIPWDKVDGLRTDADYAVALPGGSRVVGRIQYSEAGGLRVSSAARGDVKIQPEEVVDVWPADELDPSALTAAELQAKYADPWSGSFGLGISGADGNSDQSSISGRAEAIRAGENDTIRINALVNYAEQDGARSANEVILGGRLDRNLSDQSFIYGGTSLETDEFENLDLRALLTGGYGHKFYDEELFAFSGRIGAGVQYTAFRSGGSDTVGLLEFGYDLRKDYSDTLRFTHTLVLFPELDDFGDNYRAVADFGATVPLGDASDWAVRMGLNFQYNSNPSPGFEELDTTYLVNLLYKFGQ